MVKYPFGNQNLLKTPFKFEVILDLPNSDQSVALRGSALSQGLKAVLTGYLPSLKWITSSLDLISQMTFKVLVQTLKKDQFRCIQ